ncbi:hypothetical protein [Sulfobacillus harzensis]|uniref:Spore germination protein N-terminal domain-containing protein n=1 Tax=Sulfobacillus harzensis TaxID=2729629 RepID=A0A7Y0L871_9FIRM|nr:hypothetical protein [Sulfobacillus harzensis]NMP24966.1 hypothetical protein [Sulfobacillus harzensis]
MTRRLRWAAALCTALALLTGCWDQRPVEGRGVVESVGVAPTATPGVRQWTFVFPNPTESVSNLGTLPPDQNLYALAVTARTWTTALLKVQQQSTRDLYFGQFRVLVLSPRLSASTWARLITTFNRSGRILKTFYVVAGDPAGLVAQTPTLSEGGPFYGLFKLLACHCQPFMFGQRAWQVWDRLKTPGVSPVVPLIRVSASEILENRQIAVLGPKTVIPWSPAASAGWAYLTQHVVKGALTVTVDGQRIGLNRLHGSSHVTVVADAAGTRVVDRLSYRAALEDVPPTLRLTPAEKTAIAQAASHALLRLGDQAVRAAEREQVDPFGWHREAQWARNAPGSPWPMPVSWTGWTVDLTAKVHIANEGVSQ